MDRKSIWAIVTLVGGYIFCQAVADVGATKFIQVGSVAMPAGTFIFAATFTLRDLLHKRLGKEWARAAIIVAGLLNVIQALYLATIARMPSPRFYVYTQWDVIFAIIPSVTIASIVAEVTSELVDTEVYHFWRSRFARWPQWTRVLASNFISLPLDSLIFVTFAFSLLPVFLGGQVLPLLTALKLVQGQIIWKAVVTLMSLPSIYLVTEKRLLVPAPEPVKEQSVSLPRTSA